MPELLQLEGVNKVELSYLRLVCAVRPYLVCRRELTPQTPCQLFLDVPRPVPILGRRICLEGIDALEQRNRRTVLRASSQAPVLNALNRIIPFLFLALGREPFEVSVP